MAYIYKYAVVTAVPDATRGERVNVGIVIFANDKLDIRFSGVAKLSAISTGQWSDRAAELAERMKSVFEAREEPAEFITRYSIFEQWVQFSDVSWFIAETTEEYEQRIADIVAAFVKRPRQERAARAKSTKINTEIAAAFRSAKVLARDDETIDDHKVVRNYYISHEEELRADFVHKNGAFHVTATLDLRRPSVDTGQAALKAITLDKASQALSWDVKRYAVYAAAPGAEQFRPHIAMLRDYSDSIFNWLVPDERTKYTHLIYGSLGGPMPLIS